MSNHPLDQAIAMMQADSAPQYQIDTFARQFRQLSSGVDYFLREEDIAPIRQLRSLEDLPPAEQGERNYRVASLKLNGGMGTTMGLDGPKALLPVNGEQTFLSTVLTQFENGHHGDRLLLMNSFYTQERIARALQPVPVGVSCFLQGRVPRLASGTLDPLDPEAWGSAAWTPPGHGQVLDILENGLAATLQAQGFRYVCISNIDNLGATVDHVVPAYMYQNDIPWITEVSRRGSTDIKGGHIATVQASGKLQIRDMNMVASADMDAFMDINRHQYFNTGTHWVDLHAITASFRPDNMDLPLIANRKHIAENGIEADVIQLETGIGTAINLFDGAEAIAIPRTRFIPIKNIADWLLLRSGWFSFQPDGVVTEIDAARRPRLRQDDIYQGEASEVLRYYLDNPNAIVKLGQKILQY